MSTDSIQHDSLDNSSQNTDHHFDTSEWEWGVTTDSSTVSNDQDELPNQFDGETLASDTTSAHRSSHIGGLFQVTIAIIFLLLGIILGINPPETLLTAGNGFLDYTTVTNIGLGFFALGILLLLFSSRTV